MKDRRLFSVNVNDLNSEEAESLIKEIRRNYIDAHQVFEIKLSHGAKIPERNFPTDAGLDLEIRGYQLPQSKEPCWFDEEPPHDHSGTLFINPGQRLLIKTGVQIAIPPCPELGFVYEMQVRPRSGLALKKGLTILNSPGTIDANYRGDIGVILHNSGDSPVLLSVGDKIAQLVISKVFVGETFKVVEEFSQETDRGLDGFGSSDNSKR